MSARSARGTLVPPDVDPTVAAGDANHGATAPVLPGAGARRKRRLIMSPPVLMVVAYGLLASAWLASSPATASPDEGAHYLRALGAASGQLSGGAPSPLPQPVPTTQRYMWLTSRTFSLPNRLVPPLTLICTAGHPELSASCQDSWRTGGTNRGSSRQNSYVGTYQPYLYFLPGLFAHAGRSFRSGITMARAAEVLVTILLVGLAVGLLWDRESRALSLVGLAVAITPMGLFMFASVNTNGPEIAGALCLTAGLIALQRRADPPRWMWLATAAGGVVLALGRATGPGYVVAILAVVALLSSVRQLRARLQHGGGVVVIGAGAMLIATVADLGWEFAMHPHQAATLQLVMHHVMPVLRELPSQFREQVGVFGWLDTLMPSWVYSAWALLLVVLLALAYLVGTRRQRFALTAAVATYVAGTVFVGAVLMPQTGFDLQGRYTLPLALVIPLLAGEIVRLNLDRLGELRPRHLPLMFASAAAVLQGVAWWTNSRRYAVGAGGRILFWANSQWHPVLGWAPWTLLAASGALLLVASCWQSSRTKTTLMASSAAAGVSNVQ
jgi:hypothetical protein